MASHGMHPTKNSMGNMSMTTMKMDHGMDMDMMKVY